MSQKRAKLLIHACKNRSVGLLTLTAPVLETNVASSRVFSGRGETLLQCSRPTPTVRPAPAPALESFPPPPPPRVIPGRSGRPAAGARPARRRTGARPAREGWGGGSDTAQPPTPTHRTRASPTPLDAAGAFRHDRAESFDPNIIRERHR